jgi:seryl-tRNA synthetase
MIDIKLIRESPEIVKENIKKKFQNEKLPLVDKLKKKDEQWRKLKLESDSLRHERNKISKQISEAKKSKDEKMSKSLLIKAKQIPEKIQNIEEKSKKLELEIEEGLKKIPNILQNYVPIRK